MKWVVIALAIVLGLAAIVVIGGALLPREHVATRTLHVQRSPMEIWMLITDIRAFTAWRPDVTHVEPLADRNGGAAWVERTGGMAIPLEMVESQPPRRLVLRIADPTLPFGGTWTYVIAPTPEGSTLTITENGHVSNPIFRFVSRFVLGHSATIDSYLENVAKRFNEQAAQHY